MMSVVIVSMTIMMVIMIMSIVMSVTSAMMIHRSAIGSIFCFTEIVGLIPCRLDKNLECRIEMNDKDKKHEADESEDTKEYHLDAHDGKKSYDARYDKRENEENNCHNNRPEIEEYHREV